MSVTMSAARSMLVSLLQNEKVGTITESKQKLSLKQIDDGQRLEELQHASLETCSVMATDDPRCPYCIDGDAFRRLTHSDVLICKSCLHLVSLLDPKFVCECPNCREITEQTLASDAAKEVVAPTADDTSPSELNAVKRETAHKLDSAE